MAGRDVPNGRGDPATACCEKDRRPSGSEAHLPEGRVSAAPTPRPLESTDGEKRDGRDPLALADRSRGTTGRGRCLRQLADEWSCRDTSKGADLLA